MGNFSFSGNKLESVDTVSLLGLLGEIDGKAYEFLLDSGASCNFISLNLLRTLSLDWDLAAGYTVKLADGTKLKTSG